MKLKSQKGNPLGNYLVSVLFTTKFIFNEKCSFYFVDMNVLLCRTYVLHYILVLIALIIIELWGNIAFKVCRFESIVKIQI